MAKLVKFSFVMNAKDAAPILKELEHERVKSDWLRCAVTEYARTHADTQKRAKRFRRGK